MVRYKLSVVLLILGMGRAFAQPERSSSIAGRVVNSVTGAPLHRATVEITLEGRDDVEAKPARKVTASSFCERYPPAVTASASPGPATPR